MTSEQPVEKVDLDLLLSFLRKQESSSFNKFWTPAFAGVTSSEGFSTGCEDVTLLASSCFGTYVPFVPWSDQFSAIVRYWDRLAFRFGTTRFSWWQPMYASHLYPYRL